MKKTIQPLKASLLFLLTLLFLSSCGLWDSEHDFETEEVEGMRPIYVTESEIEIKNLPPQDLEEPGKIYVINDYLLVVDPLKGVHVFDNRDPKNPANVGFIQIMGSNDVAVRDNILYADQAQDLVAIDISQPENIKLASRVRNVFPLGLPYPRDYWGPFECADPSKGFVIGWESAVLNNPECYR